MDEDRGWPEREIDWRTLTPDQLKALADRVAELTADLLKMGHDAEIILTWAKRLALIGPWPSTVLRRAFEAQLHVEVNRHKHGDAGGIPTFDELARIITAIPTAAYAPLVQEQLFNIRSVWFRHDSPRAPLKRRQKARLPEERLRARKKLKAVSIALLAPKDAADNTAPDLAMAEALWARVEAAKAAAPPRTRNAAAEAEWAALAKELRYQSGGALAKQVSRLLAERKPRTERNPEMSLDRRAPKPHLRAVGVATGSTETERGNTDAEEEPGRSGRRRNRGRAANGGSRASAGADSGAPQPRRLPRGRERKDPVKVAARGARTEVSPQGPSDPRQGRVPPRGRPRLASEPPVRDDDDGGARPRRADRRVRKPP